jgi:hypothetical protein
MVIVPPEVMMSYGQLIRYGGNKKIRKGFSIVWLAFVWTIWRVRNDCVFNNVTGTVEDTVDKIQRLSWQWYLNKTAKGSSLLYEWVWDPGDCVVAVYDGWFSCGLEGPLFLFLFPFVCCCIVVWLCFLAVMLYVDCLFVFVLVCKTFDKLPLFFKGGWCLGLYLL